MGSWVDEETAACGLGDMRLNRRLGVMLAAMGGETGEVAADGLSGLGEHQGRLPLLLE